MKQDALKYSRGWAKIDIDALHHNLEEISRCSGDVPVLAVIKADGYGHGAVMLAREMEQFPGISGYAVATEEEAVSLADAGIKKPIMVLGYTFSENYEEMARRSIRATAFTEEMLHDMGRAALSCGSVMKVHIAVDTGMSRIGIRPDDSRSIRATAFTEEMLHDMGRAALSCGSVMKVHIAVDTGMSRIGIRPDDSGLDFVKKASETRRSPAALL